MIGLRGLALKLFWFVPDFVKMKPRQTQIDWDVALIKDTASVLFDSI